MKAWQSNAKPRFDTLLLALIAGAILAIARSTTALNPTLLGVRACCELGVVAGTTIFLQRRVQSMQHAKKLITAAVGIVIAYPFVAEWVLQWLAVGGEPLEFLLLNSMSLTAVVLATSSLPRLGGTSVLLSSFLVLFAITATDAVSPRILAGLYGVLGLWWLMGSYWEGIADAFSAANVEPRIPIRVSVVGVGGVLLLAVAMLCVTPESSAVALRGFMPTSGGTEWYDPSARSGVGNGDAMVAAEEDAMSFGPVESELFLDSDMPTLYDIFNDTYGEPPKKLNTRERSIGLAASEIKEKEQRVAKTERSGREFSTVRRNVQRKNEQLDDRDAPAMLYVVGRVPLHLAMQRYDTFDGRTWSQSGKHEAHTPIQLKREEDKPWAYLMRVGSSPILRCVEPHAVKVINLKTNRFASPPHLTAIHVDKVDSSDFFGWTDDGVACMPVREQIPQLTVVHYRSQGVNLQSLRERDFTAQFPLVASDREDRQRSAVDVQADLISRHVNLPDHSSEIARVALAWTGEIPRGWQQVEAVVHRLRSEYILDALVRAPEQSSDVVSDFLRMKRGPDYLFATAAAVLLRELGYPTRLVTGFYASESRYDHRAGQTPVLAEDVHTWVEVNIDGRTWVPIEPTPGYEPPRETLTWTQWASTTFSNSVGWIARNAGMVASCILLVSLLFGTRRIWLNVLAGGVCRVMGMRSLRARLRWTMRLIEWRAWMSGRSRPRQSTIAAWYSPLFQGAPGGRGPGLAGFLHWIDRVLYAPAELDPAEQAAIDAACREATSVCTFKLLEKVLPRTTDNHR